MLLNNGVLNNVYICYNVLKIASVTIKNNYNTYQHIKLKQHNLHHLNKIWKSKVAQVHKLHSVTATDSNDPK